MQYDMIYHEHMYYYSLLAVENLMSQHGLQVFDIKKVPVHSGSIRFYVCRLDGPRAGTISKDLIALRQEEIRRGYNTVAAFSEFGARVKATRSNLLTMLSSLRKKGKTLAAYGASGRANTILQYTGLDSASIVYVIDDAPAKQGLFTPGSHIPIVSKERLTQDPPDYLLLLAWGYFQDIAKELRRVRGERRPNSDTSSGCATLHGSGSPGRRCNLKSPKS